jgi:hypothetical protein
MRTFECSHLERSVFANSILRCRGSNPSLTHPESGRARNAARWLHARVDEMCLENCAPLEQPVIKEELLTCIRLSPPLRATACGARPFPSSRRGATWRSDHRSLVSLRIPLRADMTFGKAGVSTWCTSPCARLFVLESTLLKLIVKIALQHNRSNSGHPVLSLHVAKVRIGCKSRRAIRGRGGRRSY